MRFQGDGNVASCLHLVDSERKLIPVYRWIQVECRGECDAFLGEDEAVIAQMVVGIVDQNSEDDTAE